MGDYWKVSFSLQTIMTIIRRDNEKGASAEAPPTRCCARLPGPERPQMGVRRRVEPEPFVALIDFAQRALALGCPHATQHRLEAEAGLVLAPDLDGLRGVRLSQGLSLKPYLFLNSACSSKDARRLFAGRGT